MYARLTANNGEELLITLNKRDIEEIEICCNLYAYGFYNPQPIDQEYIMGQAYKTGRCYFDTQYMSNRSINKFKKWKEENDIKSPYDFSVAF